MRPKSALRTGREPVDERPREQPLAAPAVGRIQGVHEVRLADDDPEINPLESSKFTPARLEALGKAFPGERLVIPAGQPKVRNNDCDYMFRPDTTFATTPVWVPITRPAPCWS